MHFQHFQHLQNSILSGWSITFILRKLRLLTSRWEHLEHSDALDSNQTQLIVEGGREHLEHSDALKSNQTQLIVEGGRTLRCTHKQSVSYRWRENTQMHSQAVTLS